MSSMILITTNSDITKYLPNIMSKMVHNIEPAHVDSLYTIQNLNS